MTFDKASPIRTLKLFSEKAERLRQGRFAQRVFAGNTGVTISAAQGRPVVAVRHGPDQDAIEAAVLTYRFFIQDNEPCSLRNLSKLYPELPTSAYLANNYLDARQKLNDYLDGPLSVSLTINGKTLTHRDVFEALIYGDLAHSNREKEPEFKRWQQNDIVFSILENEFVVILAETMNFLWYIQMLCTEALTELEKLS